MNKSLLIAVFVPIKDEAGKECGEPSLIDPYQLFLLMKDILRFVS